MLVELVSLFHVLLTSQSNAFFGGGGGLDYFFCKLKVRDEVKVKHVC